MVKSDLKSIFDCRACGSDEERKKRYGCREDSEEKVWETDHCFVCGGTDVNCIDCGGSDQMHVRRCPRSMSQDVAWLLPYFYDWKISNRTMWPGGGPRLRQPAKLAEAFDLFDCIITEYVNEQYSKGRS